MIALGIPKYEFVTLIELINNDTITSVDCAELFQKYGDIMDDDEVLKKNENREKLYTE